MDFGGLPPEINSARMYAGPGPGSMLTSAAAWDGLASELRSTAMSYGTVTSELTDGTWQGPSSAAMEEAVTPYLAWLNSAAAEAEQTASQARAAASAYQTAFTSMVPPEAIATNRIQLAMLNATNTFGQNTPAIATVEAQYGEMWAQDAAAMYGYAGNSAAASRVTPFTAPAADHQSGWCGRSGRRNGTGRRDVLGRGSAVGAIATGHQRSRLAAEPRIARRDDDTDIAVDVAQFVDVQLDVQLELHHEHIWGRVEFDRGFRERHPSFWPVRGTQRARPPDEYARQHCYQPSNEPHLAAYAPAAARGSAGCDHGRWFRRRRRRFRWFGCCLLGWRSVGAAELGHGSDAHVARHHAAGIGATRRRHGGRRVADGHPIPAEWRRPAAGVAAAAGVGGAVASRYGPRLKVLTRSPGAGYTQTPMAPAGAYQLPPGVPPAPGYTPHIVYLPNDGQNGHNGYGRNGNGHNGNGHNGNGHNGNGHGPN